MDKGVGGLENWTIFIDVIRVSSPIRKRKGIIESVVHRKKWKFQLVTFVNECWDGSFTKIIPESLKCYSKKDWSCIP